jgi:hypothetical protein
MVTGGSALTLIHGRWHTMRGCHQHCDMEVFFSFWSSPMRKRKSALGAEDAQVVKFDTCQDDVDRYQVQVSS